MKKEARKGRAMNLEPKQGSVGQTEAINRRNEQKSTIDDRQKDVENNSTFLCKYCGGALR